MTVRKIIAKDLVDEHNAKLGYRALAKTLRNNGNKRSARTVEAISKDEADHFRLLSKIKRNLPK